MNRKALAPLLALSLAIGACGRSPLPPSPDPSVFAAEGDTLRLRRGQMAEVGAERLRILFHEIGGDSRCPRGVHCVWQGDALARLSLSYPGGSWTRAELHSHEEPRQLRDGSHLLALLGVEPYPVHEAPPIAADEYVVILRVTRP